MASKKRKTLQIKRPDPHSTKSKKKTLPKVDVDDASATSAIDTDELTQAAPKTAKIKQPNENKPTNKATRIQLPDEDKIRKARRANVTQDLEEEGALPSAEQIQQAQKSATLPIMIDTEDVDESSSPLPEAAEAGAAEKADQTMEIDADSLVTGDVGDQLEDASAEIGSTPDQTMKIDPAALVTGDVGEELSKADAPEPTSDQTMKIDPDSLVTGDVGEQLNAADTLPIEGQAIEGKDQTMQIDPDSLVTGDVGEQLAEAETDQPEGKDQTMPIDADAAAVADVDVEKHGEALAKETMQMDVGEIAAADTNSGTHDKRMAMETMQMDPSEFNAETQQEIPLPEEDEDDRNKTINLAQPAATAAEEDPDLTKEQMEESFNAMTMEMDPAVLADAMKDLEAKKEAAQEEEDGLDQTMDLTADRPKTIMIRRPSKEAGSMTPTVKAVRPDAATVRTARPVTANPTEAKEGTSRIDVPEGEATKEGKTIKLRRPSGGGSSAAPVSRVASGAGLTISADGRYVAGPKKQAELGGGWLAVAVLTFLISLGAIWSVVSIQQTELPMPGRMVGPNNQILPAPPAN